MKTFIAVEPFTTAGPYTVKMAIPFQGGLIYNPLRTADDSADCSPEVYGFAVWDTGGCCQAWGLELPDGTHLLITDADGCYLPEPDDDTGSPIMGLYDAGGEPLTLVDDFDELPRNGTVLP